MVYRNAESLRVDMNETLISNQTERATKFKDGILNSVRRGEDAGLEIYEDHADEPLPPGYVIEISAVNIIMTDAPANLVPESPFW